jgi:hypothetical protein
MNTYVLETKDAATTLIEAIWKETTTVRKLLDQAEQLEMHAGREMEA